MWENYGDRFLEYPFTFRGFTLIQGFYNNNLILILIHNIITHFITALLGNNREGKWADAGIWIDAIL